ncbi:MAG: M23 family metallopeptidase [Angelakisella sp.]
MKKFRKLLSLVLAVVMVCACVVSASATGSMPNEPQPNPNERDQITGRHYSDYVMAFKAAGITFSDVKTLQNSGFTYDQILAQGSNVRSALAKSRANRAVRPTNFILVTNINGSDEYFHPSSGMFAGDFYSKNDGEWKINRMDTFITDVYGSTNNMTNLYYLFGEWDDSEKTHQGTDMYNTNSNPELYAAHAGTVVAAGGTYGIVAIYDGTDTYFYAHCTDIKVKANDTVEVGQLIGSEGSEGVGFTHLHFEVRSGKKTQLGSTTGLNSKSPYVYM